MTELDIYNINATLTRTIERTNNQLSDHNRQIFQRFITQCKADGLGAHRINRLCAYIINLNSLLNGKPFNSVDKQSLVNALSGIEGRGWGQHTIHGLKVCVKKFFKFTFATDEYPECVKWIRCTIKKDRLKLPQPLTQEEVQRMIEHADGTRNRAIIAVLFDSGVRVGELVGMKKLDVSFDQHGAIIMVSGKTGSRPVRIISSAPYLAAWLESMPDKTPSAYIWQKTDGILLCPNRINMIMKATGLRAGINKRLYPHLGRHTSATLKAGKVSEAVNKIHHGWKQSSGMTGVYVHLAHAQTDTELLKAAGVIRQEETTSALPVTCPRCKEKNGFTAAFCYRCGAPMNEKIALEADLMDHKREDLLSEILSHPSLAGIIADIKSKKQANIGKIS